MEETMRSLSSLMGLNGRGIAAGIAGQRKSFVPKQISLMSLFGMTARATYPSIANEWKNGVFGDMGKKSRGTSGGGGQSFYVVNKKSG
jgi:hypothetical protein